MKTSRLVILASAVPISMFGAALPFHQQPRPECAVLITNYRNASVWDDAGTRILVEAGSACAGRPGRALELTGVQLTIEKAGKRIARIYSPTGTISPRQGRMILGAPYGPNEAGSIAATGALLVDLRERTVRSPSGVYLDLAKNTSRM